MPQMMPMYWLLMTIMTMMLLMIIMNFIYFLIYSLSLTTFISNKNKHFKAFAWT